MKKVFLDTCVLLDYFENRDRETACFVQNLIDNPKIEVRTAVFNVIEMLDKIQEIRHMAKLVQKRYSFDEISRDRQIKKLSPTEREEILNELNNFLEESKIITFYFKEMVGYGAVIDVLSKVDLKSQDAVIVTTYLDTDSDMFITKDSNLIKNVKDKFSKDFFNAKNDLKKIKKELGIV